MNYIIGDKRAIAILDKTSIKPAHFKEKTDKILCADKSTLNSNVALVKALFNETVELTHETYKPFYNL